MIVGVQFESKREPGTFYGREYSYLVAEGIELAAGDVVKVPTANGEGTAKVTHELRESQVDERVIPKLKTITSGPIKSAQVSGNGIDSPISKPLRDCSQMGMDELLYHGTKEDGH